MFPYIILNTNLLFFNSVMSVKQILEFAKSLVGKPYSGWSENKNTLGGKAPFWVCESKPPPIQHINSLCCTGLINLIYRYLGKQIPGINIENFLYPGGTWVWFDTLKKNKKLSALDTKKSYPIGTLLLRNYKDFMDQGHVAIICEECGENVLESKLIHSYYGKGVAIELVADSFNWFNGNYYTHVCLPNNWLL